MITIHALAFHSEICQCLFLVVSNLEELVEPGAVEDFADHGRNAHKTSFPSAVRNFLCRATKPAMKELLANFTLDKFRTR